MARAEPELRPCGIAAGYVVASGHTKPSEFAPDPPNQRTVLGISLYEVSFQVEDVDDAIPGRIHRVVLGCILLRVSHEYLTSYGAGY
jgi:hypothetical protein